MIGTGLVLDWIMTKTYLKRVGQHCQLDIDKKTIPDWGEMKPSLQMLVMILGSGGLLAS